jgi:hypothetical protein
MRRTTIPIGTMGAAKEGRLAFQRAEPELLRSPCQGVGSKDAGADRRMRVAVVSVEVSAIDATIFSCMRY